MYFQKVLKGVSGLSDLDALSIATETGILCNWWRAMREISPQQVLDQLTEANLLHHLNDYDLPLPSTHPYAGIGATYGEVTPFISTTAGTVQRQDWRAANILFSPFLTALSFATNRFSQDGYIFYAYLNTIGKKAVPLQHIAEEVRELHIYTQYLPYHREGEIAAKIHIPVVSIEKAEKYDGPTALHELSHGNIPTAINTIVNPHYQAPEQFSNIRELL